MARLDTSGLSGSINRILLKFCLRLSVSLQKEYLKNREFKFLEVKVTLSG